MIHIHGDVDGLKYFSDINGVCAYSNMAVAYAMQDADIVGIFYTTKQAKEFYERNKLKENLPVIYFWDEKRWNNRKSS
jgi:hypothetical protein